MRLRSLRKLEEMEIRARARRALTKERSELEALLASEDKQWKTIADEIEAVQEDIRPGDRRSASAARASPTRRSDVEADSARP